MADRLLVISYAYPPLAAPEAVLSAKAVHTLEGFEVDVICIEPARWHRRDESLVEYAEAGVGRIVRLPVPWWLPVLQPAPGMRRYPDAMRFLRRRARAAAVALGIERYAGLLTWSQWHSVHLVGLDLGRAHPKLPWLAHFSDPWVDNPLVPLRPLARRLSLRMERAVLERADAVEFTAQATRDQTMARHPPAWSDKAHVVPHLFDDALYPGPAPERPEGIVMRHLGSFYGHRRPSPILAAVAEALARRPSLASLLRVELVGSLPDDMAAEVAAAPLPPGVVVARPTVSYRRSLELMRSADVLLAVDAPGTRSVFLASKVVDYVGAERPTVALVPPGAAADAVHGLGGWVADPSDAVAGGEALLAAIDASGAASRWGLATGRHPFSAETVGHRRSDLLRNIVERSSWLPQNGSAGRDPR